MATFVTLAILMDIVICSELVVGHQAYDVVRGDLQSKLSRPKFHSCGENFCRCNITYALCIQHYDKLTYIPKLADSINGLNFSSNRLENITSSTFQNISIPQILYLCLRNNSITHIAGNTFNGFKNIEYLDLGKNPISDIDLEPALYGLRYSKLKYLFISDIDIIKLDSSMFKGIKFLRSLSMRNINIESIDFTIMLELRFLYALDLAYNKLSNIVNPWLLNLKYLYLDSNNLKFFPRFCKKINDSSLQKLDLSHNKLISVSKDHLKCLRRLTHLYLIHNYLQVIDSNSFSYLSSLEDSYITKGFASGIHHGQRIKEYAFNNSALRRLYAHELDLFFHEQVSKDAFKGCDNLEVLSIRHDNLQMTNDSYFINLLGGMTRLRNLSITRSELTFFPRVVSERLTNIENLELYGNIISVINEGSFDRMKKLKRIMLGKNVIVHVSSELFSPQIRKQLEFIDLSNNDLSCTCDNLWFIQWMKADFSKFGGYPNSYKCGGPSDPRSTLMINASLSEQICSLSSTIIPVILGFIILTLIVISVMYRWRWHIIYYIHMFRYRKRNKPQNEENLFTFDAFVLFCEDDILFVRDHLMPRLEDEGGISLCVHHRDFTPGKYIVNNIIDSLDNSRKVILLLSNRFSESSWCEFELTLVQKRALENHEGYLLVVLLEDLQAMHMIPSVCALLQTTTYITWPREEEDRELFWQRVKTSLEH